MSHLRVLIVQVDDPTSETMTELASFDLPAPDPATLQPATALDELETTTLTTGTALLRRLLQARWDLLDAALTDAYRQRHPPGSVRADGNDALTIVSRFGTLPLRRRQLYHPASTSHVVPGNAILPAHAGVVITRGLLERAVPADLAAVLVPHDRPRRRAGWPVALTAAVETALAAAQVRPPAGVSWADWERVLAARQAEAEIPIEALRHLGPHLAADEVLLTVDEVLTPKADGTGRWELRTAKLVTPQGYRYVSGTGAAFLPVVLALTLAAVGPARALLLISDGARWIRTFFSERLAHLPRATHLLNWFHLEQKCRDLGSRICRGREAKGVFLRWVYRRLWAGQVAAAVAWLEGYRPQTRNAAVLEELIGYLQARAAWIPNYRQRRRERQYIGSGHVEQANDLIVARRQKQRGMGWSRDTSDSLAALRTLVLNDGWDRYWTCGDVLPMVTRPAA